MIRLGENVVKESRS